MTALNWGKVRNLYLIGKTDIKNYAKKETVMNDWQHRIQTILIAQSGQRFSTFKKKYIRDEYEESNKFCQEKCANSLETQIDKNFIHIKLRGTVVVIKASCRDSRTWIKLHSNEIEELVKYSFYNRSKGVKFKNFLKGSLRKTFPGKLSVNFL